MNKSSLSPGIILNSRYRVEKILGYGGFGITYLCRDTKTGKEVAVKELFRDKLCSRLDDGNVECHNTEAQREFERLKVSFEKESALLSGLSHPNIVHVFDSFEQNNTAYYAMDYVEGCSLDRIIEEKALPEEQAFGVISHIASALQYLHSRNILHLDLKPANIIIDSDLKPTIIDFGEATDISGTRQKKNDEVAISSGFAALEQYRPGSSLSAAADIYALGATYYAMLTGKVPPVATDLISRAMSSRIIEEMSQRAKWAITQAMKPEASGRPDAERFIKMADRNIPMEDLVESLENETISEKLKSFANDFSTKSKSAWRNYPMTVVSAGILVLLLLVTVGLRQGWLAPRSSSVLIPAATMEASSLLPEDNGHASELRELIHDINIQSSENGILPGIRLKVNEDTLTVCVYLNRNSYRTFNSLRNRPTSFIACNLAATSSLYCDIMNLTSDNGLKLRTEYIYIPDGTKITTNQPWAPLNSSDEQAFKDFGFNLNTVKTSLRNNPTVIFDGKNLYYPIENLTEFYELKATPYLNIYNDFFRNTSEATRIIHENEICMILVHEHNNQRLTSQPIPFEFNYQ